MLICGPVRYVHFRRYISKKAVAVVLASCPNLAAISLSRCASQRLSEDMLSELQARSISIIVSKNRGRKPKFASIAQPIFSIREICDRKARPKEEEKHASVAQLGRAADLYQPELVGEAKISAGCRFKSGPGLARVAHPAEHLHGKQEAVSSSLISGSREVNE